VKRWWLIAALVAAGCAGKLDPTPVQPPAPTQPGPATCLDLCRHGVQLNCPWAADTPNGASCSTVCQNNQDANITSWDLDCRTRSSSCAAPGCQ